MKAVLQEIGAPERIHWRRKFVQIVSNNESGVELELDDGSSHRSDLLVGADGVHSRLRQYIADMPAVYSGYTLCLSNSSMSSLKFPPELEEHRCRPTTIQTPTGGFNYVAQGPQGRESFCLRQFHHPEQDPAGWHALRQDKTQLLSMLRQDYDFFPSLVKIAMDASEETGMDVCPIYTVPKLDRWTSANGRVVLIGDAAHALPPAAGQGVNMAIEDAYSLVLLLEKLKHGISLARGLLFWQSWRQERVEKVRTYAMQLSMARTSAEERARHAGGIEEPPHSASGQLIWLFAPEPGLEKQIELWVREQSASME